MILSNLESLPGHPGRRQEISSIGLAVLYGAVWVALTGGLVTPLGIVTACLPALVVGGITARIKEWPVMALVSIIGNLACLAVGGREGVPGEVLFAGLLLQLVATSLVGLRASWLWPSVAATFGAFCLLNLWHVGAAIQPGLLLVGLAAAWLTGVLTGIFQKVAGQDQAASWVTATTAVIATISIIVACGFSAELAALLGTLMAIQGLVHDQAPGKPSSTGKFLLMTGMGLGAIAAWLWICALGLVVGLGVWGPSSWSTSARIGKLRAWL